MVGFGVVMATVRMPFNMLMGFPGGASGKETSCQSRRLKRHWFDTWVGKNP